MQYLDFAITFFFLSLLVLACAPASRFTGRTRFRLRRTRNWFMLGSLYACYYLCRHNLGVANKSICTEFGLSREQFGYIITAALWAYAIGQAVNGFLADRIGGKRTMLLGAAGTVAFNILFGVAALWSGKLSVASMLSTFVVIRLLDGYMQSMGSPGWVKINTAWFSRPERGGLSGIFGFMIQMGQVGIQRFIGPAVLTGTLTVALWPIKVGEPLHWQYLFWIPAAITTAVALIMAFVVKPTPEAAGFQRVGEVDGKALYEHGASIFRSGSSVDRCPQCQYSMRGLPDHERCPECGFLMRSEEEEPAPLPVFEMLRTILTHRGVWFCAIAYFCTGFVRYGVLNWYLRFLEDFGVGPSTWLYRTATLAVALVAVIGSLGAGYISDLVFKGRRAPVAAAMYILETAIILSAAFFIHDMTSTMKRDSITIQSKADDGTTLKVAAVRDGNGTQLASVPGIGLATLFIVLVALTCNSTHSIIGTAAAMDIGERKMAGFASGVIDSFQYIAGGLTGFFVGGLIDKHGYTWWMLCMAPAGIIGSVCMLIYQRSERRHMKETVH